MADELTPAQKVQAEYNQAIGMLGHTIAQILRLEEDKVRYEAMVKKIMNKANNIPKEQHAEPIVEEVKDGTAG